VIKSARDKEPAQLKVHVINSARDKERPEERAPAIKSKKSKKNENRAPRRKTKIEHREKERT
jgi:hypothetical protein